jgi:outer membrane murein-binding lipoprotein Lpp
MRKTLVYLHKLLTKRKMKNLLLFGVLALCLNSYGQSKKQQIVALNYSIDSLNIVLETTRDNASKDIDGLNTTIDSLNSEIAQLKSDVSSLESSTTKLTSDNEKLKLDLEEMSKKNLELEVKLEEMLMKNLELAGENNRLVWEDNENNWVISNSTPFLNSGLWIGDCAEERSVETPCVEFRDGYMIFGIEGGFGGTIQNIFYNSYSKKFKIIYVNNNEMAGDGTLYEFILSYEDKGGSRSLIFQEEMLTPDYNYGSNEILTYHFCD